jgi:Domain of unknown function (DUF7025)
VAALTEIADFDGKEFSRYPFEFTIPRYDGSKKINSLRCYPLKHHEQEANIRPLLRERGGVFRKLCLKEKGEQMFEYDGEASFNRTVEEVVEAEYGGGTGPLGLGFIMAAEMQKQGERVSFSTTFHEPLKAEI